MQRIEYKSESPMQALLSPQVLIAVVAMLAFFYTVQTPDIAIQNGNLQVKQGQDTQQVLKDVQKLKPYKLMMQGKLTDAVIASNKLLEAEPNDVAANWCSALIALKTNQKDSAFDKMRRTMALVPKNRALRLEYARLLGTNGRVDEAVTQYKLITAQAKEAIPPRMELATLYLANDKPLDAAAVLQELIDIKPNESNAHKLRGIALARAGQAEDGMNEYNTGVVTESASGQHQAVRLLLTMWGDIDKAKFQLERQIQEHPDDPMPKLRLAEIYLYIDKPMDAKQYLIDARKLAPQNPEIHRTLCIAYKKLGDSKLALTSFMQSIALDQQLARKKKRSGQS